MTHGTAIKMMGKKKKKGESKGVQAQYIYITEGQKKGSVSRKFITVFFSTVKNQTLQVNIT